MTLGRVYFLLLLFLFLTALASNFPLGSFSLLVALTFATLKAALVVWFFMELRNTVPKIRLIASVGIIWFLLLASITLTDYFTRGLIDTFGK